MITCTNKVALNQYEDALVDAWLICDKILKTYPRINTDTNNKIAIENERELRLCIIDARNKISSAKRLLWELNK